MGLVCPEIKPGTTINTPLQLVFPYVRTVRMFLDTGFDVSSFAILVKFSRKGILTHGNLENSARF